MSTKGQGAGGWSIIGHLVNVVCERPLGQILVETANVIFVPLRFYEIYLYFFIIFEDLKFYDFSRNYREIRFEIPLQASFDHIGI